ncbi:MAG TPA: SGNH/GDSL hydrolase family protein [Blastocatellia bacterium]|nr:SGNH/GDSL hydrolase family protein [Blastocatellia bacterium]
MKRLVWTGLFVLTLVASAAAQDSNCAEEKARADRAERRLQDWPFLQRYRELNSKVTAPAKDERRVVFMGDSITDGWKFADYFAGKPYINRGISGQTTPQMLIRFRPDVIALKPRVVVILAGTNDIAGNTGPTTLESIEGNLMSMADLAHANGINVVFCSVLPVSDYHKNKEGKQIIQTVRRPPEQIRALNDWMKRYASDNGMTYLDYYSPSVDDKGFLKEELSYDGLHPSARGYEVMAPLVEQAIAAAMKKKH